MKILKLTSILTAAFLYIGCSTSASSTAAGTEDAYIEQKKALFAEIPDSLITSTQKWWRAQIQNQKVGAFVFQDSGSIKPLSFLADALDTAGSHYDIYEQAVEGQKQYFMVIPADSSVSQPSVIYYCHGGEKGIAMSEITSVLATLGPQRRTSTLVFLAYRGETFTSSKTTYSASASAIPWKTDVLDLFAIQKELKSIAPNADTARAAVVGISRGATVAHIFAQQNPNVKKVILYFGMSSLVGEAAQVEFDLAFKGTPRDLPGLNYLNTQLVQPFKNQLITADSVRFELVLRSPLLTLSKSPKLQIHHGLLDTIVAPSESKNISDALVKLGRSDEYYEYPDKGHAPFLESKPKVRSFLQSF